MLRIVLLLPFFFLTQDLGLVSNVLFAQNFGSARGPASRSAVPQVAPPQIAPPQVVQPQVAQSQSQVALQWNQTNQTEPAQKSSQNSLWNPASDPHPSVVRIIAFDKGERTHVFGSGTYISSYGRYGIIITNWHVVRDSDGLIQVHFPDHFGYYAAVISNDPTWDLAVLLISKPENTPMVSIAQTAPKVGDPLWIAGYGSGKYRLIGGHCTQYITPETGLKNEFVELSVEARQGDSGGPIFNQKGELAGVLFGSDSHNTAGSYCGRVRLVLEQSKERIKSVPPKPEDLFARIEPGGKPRHTLNEGAELFQYQIVHSNKSSSVIDPPQYTYSDPRKRGSASSREIKPVTTANQTTFPNFPNFSKQIPKQDNTGQSSRTVPTEIHYNTTQNAVINPPVASRSSSADPKVSQPSERIAMAVPPLNSSPLFAESTVPAVESVLLSESALMASSRPGNFFTTLKIITAIIVVFFVIFHLVKLMSIIEEN